MAIIDNLLRVSSAQALTATAVSEDSVDITNARDIGAGEPIVFVFELPSGPLTASGGSATLVIDVISADNAALTSNVVVHNSSPSIAEASLVQGFRHILDVPMETNVGADRYWGARYTVSTANFDGVADGTVEGYFAPRSFVNRNNQYASGLRMTGF